MMLFKVSVKRLDDPASIQAFVIAKSDESVYTYVESLLGGLLAEIQKLIDEFGALDHEDPAIDDHEGGDWWASLRPPTSGPPGSNKRYASLKDRIIHHRGQIDDWIWDKEERALYSWSEGRSISPSEAMTLLNLNIAEDLTKK